MATGHGSSPSNDGEREFAWCCEWRVFTSFSIQWRNNVSLSIIIVDLIFRLNIKANDLFIESNIFLFWRSFFNLTILSRVPRPPSVLFSSSRSDFNQPERQMSLDDIRGKTFLEKNVFAEGKTLFAKKTFVFVRRSKLSPRHFDWSKRKSLSRCVMIYES